jgi:L-ascorbate metabolism protein UlaG (beta-lactamase superfamily)
MLKRTFMLAALIAPIGMIAGTRGVCAQLKKIKILWLGESALKITTPTGKVIFTDPWLRPNTKTPPEYKDLTKLGKVDVIQLSHAHYDHRSDAIALAKMHSVPITRRTS